MPLATCQGCAPHCQLSIPHQDTSWLPVQVHPRSPQGVPCCSTLHTWWARITGVSSSQHSCAMFTYCACTCTDCHFHDTCCIRQAVCTLVGSSHHCSSDPSKEVCSTKTYQAITSSICAHSTTEDSLDIPSYLPSASSLGGSAQTAVPDLDCPQTMTWLPLHACNHDDMSCQSTDHKKAMMTMCFASPLISRRQPWWYVTLAHWSQEGNCDVSCQPMDIRDDVTCLCPEVAAFLFDKVAAILHHLADHCDTKF